ncbi:hypothetical protein HPP92_028503 [Vanilla planifolia]|uniref:Uncharacterized protein n=1 Tax=Vanilla planifolia TaxID=51239 RepID=A0A835U5N5_VANPL|nr:hypothetical protein HPP92_028503 [Vanilla planifolia]
MADYSAIPSCAQARFRTFIPEGNLAMPRNVNLRRQDRDFVLFARCHHTCTFSKSRFYIVPASIPICREGGHSLSDGFFKCYCWGTVVDPENAASLKFVCTVDQLLLIVSAIFTYIAGAVPQTKGRCGFRSEPISKSFDSSSSSPYGRSKTSENIPYLSANAIWDEVNRKLLDSLYTTGIDTDDQNVDFIESKAYALSIFALSKGSTWRLLRTTLWNLQKEVNEIISSHEVFSQGTWMAVVSQVLQRVVSPTCIKWLEEEFFLDDTSCNMNVFQLSKKLMGNDVILNNVKRLGKSELYADLLFFLRFDAVRSECCYDSRFIAKHGVEILEDLVISLADAIACIYLELISVDSDISSEMNTLGLKICPLSTRSLQRLRNEVLLKQWLQQNFESVISLYEDRFELLVLSREKLDDMAKSQSKSSIWQKLIFRRQWTASRSNYVRIKPISLTVKRTKELQALTGWRYYFSLLLEFFDVAMPLLITFFNQARNAVSFFLMCMIGRSLGLIFSGIRQSLGWK